VVLVELALLLAVLAVQAECLKAVVVAVVLAGIQRLATLGLVRLALLVALVVLAGQALGHQAVLVGMVLIMMLAMHKTELLLAAAVVVAI
jgi:hypothetical protein